jgi:hypothetical protein
MNYFANQKLTNSEVLPAGQYRAVLRKVLAGEGRAYDGSSPRQTLSFVFETIPELKIINRTVTASNSSKGKLIELVRAMAGANQPSEAILFDGDKLTTFINTFVGKEFLIQVRPSDNGRFSNLVSLTTLPAHLQDAKGGF